MYKQYNYVTPAVYDVKLHRKHVKISQQSFSFQNGYLVIYLH